MTPSIACRRRLTHGEGERLPFISSEMWPEVMLAPRASSFCDMFRG